MKKLIRSALLLGILVSSSGALLAAPTDYQQVFKTTKSWNDAPMPGFSNGKSQFQMFRFKLAPGAKLPIHLHPINGAGYVIAGELTMYSTDDPHGSFADKAKVHEVTFKAGSGWAEAVNTWHYGENKSDKEAEVLIVFAGEEGTPPTLTLGTYIDAKK